MKARAALLLVLACMASGLLTSNSDAAPLPIKNPPCGEVWGDEPGEGSFRLGGDIGTRAAPCAGDGLLLDRPGLTIDLNRNAIWGSSVGNDDEDGIDVQSNNGTTIRNGLITGFDHGVTPGLIGTRRLAVRNMVLAQNEDGILVDGPGPNTVANNVVAFNLDDGIVAGGRARITGNRVIGNDDGIIFVEGADTSIASNIVTRNQGDGIQISLADNVTVTNNLAAMNDSDGIDAAGSTTSTTITGNRSVKNGGDGIASSGPVVTRNQVHANDDGGILVTGPARVARNTATVNENSGVFIDDDGATVSSNVLTGNGSGIFASGDGDNATINGNRIMGSGLDDPENFSGLALNVTAATGVTGSNNVAYGSDDDSECTDDNLCIPPPASNLPEASPACNGAIDSSIRLTADVGTEAVPCTGYGLSVTEPNVTIDLNGHTIWGDDDGLGDDVGIEGNERGLRVRNGMIRGFEYGVYAEQTATTATGMVIADNANFGVITDTSATVADSAVLRNGEGLTFNFSDNENARSRALRNVVAYNGDDGIELTPEGDSLSVGNIVYEHTDRGIASGRNRGNIVIDNVRGIVSSEPLSGNLAVGNDTFGLLVSLATSVTGNVVVGNDTDGIGLAGGTASNNKLIGNGDDGIETGATSRVLRNEASGNTANGILVPAGASATIRANRAVGNGWEAADAGELGIDASAGDEVGGSGNVAYGNDTDEAVECDPGSLC